MKYYTILAATAAMSIASSAFAADESAEVKTDVEYKDNGGYEATASAEQKSADGTLKTTEATEEVEVDDDGMASKTVEKTTTIDPKGLMNKAEKTTELEVEDTENGGYEKTLTKKYVDPNGTNVTVENETEVEVDDEGNVTKTITEEKTVDPKGLFNKKTTTNSTTSVNGKVE